MRSIGHIINPVNAGKDTELGRVQPITFASLLNAREHAEGKVDVTLMTTQFATDHPILPEGFQVLPDLTQSVEEVANIQSDRRLPLLRDILQRAYENSTAEYIIYSNVDIGVDPGFYTTIDRLIDEGFDGLIIHRRRVSPEYKSVDDLDAIYTDAGKPHTGFDTFVFKREIIPDLQLGDVCVGIPGVGNLLAYNLFAACEKFKAIADKHLTFHIGMELYKTWGSKAYMDHNYRTYKRIVKELYPRYKIANVPGANRGFFKRQFMWLMNPNYYYPVMFKLDMNNLSTARQPKPSKITSPRGYYEWLVRKLKTDD